MGGGRGVCAEDPFSENKSFKETTEVVDSESVAKRDNPHFTKENLCLYLKLRNRADILGNEHGVRIK